SRSADRSAQSVIGGACAPAPVVWQRLQLFAPPPPPLPPTSWVTILVTVGHGVTSVVAVNVPASEPAGNEKLPSSSVYEVSVIVPALMRTCAPALGVVPPA